MLAVVVADERSQLVTLPLKEVAPSNMEYVDVVDERSQLATSPLKEEATAEASANM